MSFNIAFLRLSLRRRRSSNGFIAGKLLEDGRKPIDNNIQRSRDLESVSLYTGVRSTWTWYLFENFDR